jgi:hypothetical protein
MEPGYRLLAKAVDGATRLQTELDGSRDCSFSK